jgi:sugar phosphate isomerase/epimerase
MLKYSFMTFACPEYTLEEVIRSAAKHGYDGVEPRVESDHGHGIELGLSKADCRDIAVKFDDAGVELCCLATSVCYNQAEPSRHSEMIDLTKRYCELAAEVGCRRIRVFGGHSEDDASRETEIGRVRDGLAASVQGGLDTQVTICLETHDAFCKGADVARIVREVDSRVVRANWDVQHPVTAGEDIEFTEGVLMSLTEHAHFHDTDRTDGKADCAPIGAGQASIRELLAIFAKHQFSGYLSGEWFYNNGPEKDLQDFITSLKSIEATL